MTRIKTSLSSLLILAGVLGALNPPAAAAWGMTPEAGTGDRLTVEVASGRRFAAELDVRTDADQLWLRWNGRSGYLLRPIDWDRVQWVELNGEVYTGREVQEAVALIRETTPTPEIILAPAAMPTAPPDLCLTAGPLPPPPSYVAAHRFEPPRVRSVAIEAHLANWDGDVEADGLLLDLYPLDGAGFVLPVRGTLQVELIGEATGSARSGQPYAVLGRWTEQVCPVDFDASGARYKLPFRQTHPEFDLRWAPKGLVHVRLAVPGEGLFEASRSMVRIRSASAMRDRLQQAAGQRFFSFERTGQ
jgi:hypothetical protein